MNKYSLRLSLIISILCLLLKIVYFLCVPLGGQGSTSLPAGVIFDTRVEVLVSCFLFIILPFLPSASFTSLMMITIHLDSLLLHPHQSLTLSSFGSLSAPFLGADCISVPV